MNFYYKARTKDGIIETGTIEAYSKEDAVSLLQKYNVFVVSLEEEKKKQSLFTNLEFTKKVSQKDLAIFFRQLSLMLESRVPVVQSLSSLSLQTNKKIFREAILKIADLVEEGLPLSEAFSHYPLIFDGFYINLIKSGEASGKIAQALYYVSDHLEKESDIMSEVKQAMIYPSFVMAVLLVVMVVIIRVFMPRIVSIIKDSGVQPSFFTILIIQFYAFIGTYWWALIVITVLLIGAIIYYLNTNKGKEMYHRLSLKIPLLKDFLKKVFLARFCSNISTLLLAGISINRALAITGETVNNIVYEEIIAQIDQRVSEGEKMSVAMAQYPDYFPLFVIQMVKVGEETGKLDEVLRDVVAFYQKEIKRNIDLFSKLLEPIIIVLLGLVVTILAISILSSIYGAIETI